MPTRFPLRSLATLALAIGVATCSDSPHAVVKTAPDGGSHPGKGRFALAPRFSSQAAAVYAQRSTFAAVNFDHVRIVLTRPPNEVVIDTIITFNPASPPTTLDLFVDVKSTGEVFDGAIQYTNNGAVVYQASAKVQSYPPDQVAPTPQELVVVYVGPGATATRLAVSPKTSSVVAPGITAFSVVAFDAQNNVIDNVPIAWSISDASIAALSTTSGPQTTVTPTGKRGTATVTAAGPLTALRDNATLSVTLPPAAIVLVSGGGQTGKAGSPLASPGVVRVVASDGIGIPGVSVQFGAPSGGSVGSASTTTDASGNATSSLTLGGALGAQSFAASAAGFSVSIPATATPGDPSVLAILSGQGQTDTVNRALKAPFVVRVTDRFGNAVSSVTVTWAKTSGGGTLSGTSSVTAADGTASIGYTLGATAGPETVTATVAAIATSVTFTATAVTGPAGIAIVSGSGQTGRVGQALGAPLVVKVTDAANAPVTGAVVTWSATNGSVSGGATTDAQGQASATFTLGNTVGGATATATVGTGATAKSVTFTATVQAGTVAKIVFKTGPAAGTAATILTPFIEVELQDAGGNRTTAVNAVTLAIGANPGQATLGGTLTRNAVAGIATFNDITLSSPGTAYTLIATSAGVSNIASAPFDITGTVSNTRTWSGALSTNWLAAGNWVGGVAPTGVQDVVIPAGTPNSPVLTSSVALANLTVAAGATMNVGTFGIVASGSVDALGAITGTGTMLMTGAGTTLRGTIPRVSFTSSVSINGALTAPGGVTVNQGATVTIAGNSANIGPVAIGGGFFTIGAGATVTASSLSVTQTGRFVQTGGTMIVLGDATFNGASSVGQITAGTLTIGGNFTQAANITPSSFVASGTHRTVFASATAQTISIASPAQTQFANLEIDGPGTLTTNAGITATGQLISLAGPSTLSGVGSTVSVAGLDVDGLTLDNQVLVSTNGTITRFDNVTMQNYAGAITPLTILHPGAATSFTFNNTQFLVTPTGGNYLSVTDANPSDGLVLTIDLVASNPPNGSAQTATLNGAVVNWGGTSPSIAWTNPLGGSWSLASNWSLNRVPNATDSVVIALAGTYTIQLDTTFTGKSIVLAAASGTQTLVLNTRGLTINNIVTVGANGVFQINNSSIFGTGSFDNLGTLDIRQVTFNMPVRNQGSFLVAGTVAVNGAMTTTTTSAIHIQGNGTNGGASFVTSTGFTNNGTIDMTSTGGAFSTSLSVTSGTFINANTVTIPAGTVGPRIIDAPLNNQGTIALSQTLTLQRNNLTHVNNGLINLLAGDFTINASGVTFTNAGNILTTAGRIFTMSNGTYIQTGSINGAGTASFTTVNATFNNNITNATTTYAFVTSTVNGPGTITNAAGRTMSIRSTSFANNTAFNNQGTLNADGNNPMNAPFTMAAGAVLNLTGNGAAGNATFAVANSFTNNGAINLTSTNGGFTATLTVTTGTFTNGATGVVTSVVGTGGARDINAVLDNQGTIVADQSLSFARASAAHVNSGTITVNNSATLTLAQTGTSPSFTNTGTLTINFPATMNVSGGTFNQNSATFGGAGTISLASTTANFTQPFTNATTTIAITNTTLNGTTFTNVAGRTLTIVGTTISTTGGFTNQGTLIAQGINSVAGAVTTAAGSIIRALGNSTFGNSTLSFANGFTNLGGIEFTTAGGGFTTTMNVVSGTLTNGSGGTITSLVGNGGPRVLNAQLDNQSGGIVAVQQGMTLSRASATHTNAGSIDVSAGGLTISQSGTTPSFTNASGGAIILNAGAGFTVVGGTFTHGTGASLSGAGTVGLSSTTADFQTTFAVGALSATASTVNFQSALSTAGMTTTFFNSTITGQATITNVAGQQMNLTGATINTTNGFANQGTVFATGTNDINGTFTTAAGSLLRMQGNSSVGNSTLTIANSFTNNGTIEYTTVGGGFSVTLNVTGGGSLINSSTGLITSLVGNGGPRILNAALTNNAGGTVNIDQSFTMNAANVPYVNNGTILVNGTAALTVAQGGASPSFQNGGTMTIAPTASVVVTGGVFSQLSTATMNGGGAFSSTTTTVNFQSGFTLGALSITGANVTFSSPVTTTGLALTFTNTVINGPTTITNVAGQTMTLNGPNFSANAPIVNQGTILSTGGTVINGAYTAAAGSTLRLQGNSSVGNATMTIANGFTNNGLIDMTTTGGGFSVTFNVAAGTLTNAGSISSNVGNGGPRILNAQLVNQATGTLATAQDLTMNRGSATYTNAGIINLTTGNLTLSQSAGFGLTNTGTITVAPGHTFTVNNGTFTQASGATLNGGGGLTTTGGATTTLNSGFTLTNIDVTANSAITIGQSITLPSGTTMNVLNSVVNSSGNFNIANAAGATMNVRASTVSVGIVSLSNSGTVNVEGASNFGNTVANAGTIHVEGNPTGGNATMTMATLLNNNGGLIELANAGGGFVADIVATSGLTNNTGGTITSISGGSIRTIHANVTNSGTINIAQGGTGILTIFGNLSNSGGTLNFKIAGTTPGITYDQLQVTGTAQFGLASPNGTLNASIIGTPNIPATTLFNLITNYTGASGSIANYNLPTASWTHAQGATVNITSP